MSKKSKLIIFVIAYVLCFIGLYGISVIELNSSEIALSIIMYVSLLLSIAITSLGILGVVIELYFTYKYRSYIKIYLTKKLVYHIFFYLLYVCLLLFLYVNQVTSRNLQLMAIIIPFTFYNMRFQCSQYFIINSNQVLYLNSNFLLYIVTSIKKEQKGYVLTCINENRKEENVIIENTKLINHIDVVINQILGVLKL